MTCGILTLTDALFQEAYIFAPVGGTSPDYNSRPQGPDFHPELIPVHSPLLRESYLVSFPPLTYMLKFSGFADLTSCLEKVLDTRWQGSNQKHEQTTSRMHGLLCPRMVSP